MDDQSHHEKDHAECLEAIDRLYRYLDGELEGVDQVDVQRHLEACMPCLEAFEFEAELKVFIASRCREQAPTHLRTRIVHAIFEERPGPGGIPSL